MRFAPIWQSLALLAAGIPACFAQQPLQPAKPCAAARIFTPPESFTMPIAKPPQVKDGVVSTVPACQQVQPKPVMVKRLQIQPAPQLKKLQLLPNPFASPAPAAPKPE